MCHDLMLDSDVLCYYRRRPLMVVFQATPTERQLTESLVLLLTIVCPSFRVFVSSMKRRREEGRVKLDKEKNREDDDEDWGRKREKETRQRYAWEDKKDLLSSSSFFPLILQVLPSFFPSIFTVSLFGTDIKLRYSRVDRHRPKETRGSRFLPFSWILFYFSILVSLSVWSLILANRMQSLPLE